MKIKALCAGALAAALVAFLLLRPHGAPGSKAAAALANPAVPHAPAAAAPPAPAAPMEMAMAFEQKSVSAEFIGNGRERMKVMLANLTKAPVRVTVPIGQMFNNEHNCVVAVRPSDVELAPGESATIVVQTAATKSSNVIEEAPFELSYANITRIEPLLSQLQARAEMNPGAIQTAILALAENLPLSSVAKFALASNPLPSRFNTDPFRVETFDIVTALATLREIGVKDESLAMTVDPQLKIEAMIDPNARPMAMNYYGIDADREWEFWRNELLNGEPCTRHYALYGIARFYPDIALQMLPRWAREKRTNPVYRLSAVQALADTQRGEALTLLRELSTELGKTTELGKAAAGAASYLDYRLSQLANARTVAFHTSSNQNGQN